MSRTIGQVATLLVTFVVASLMFANTTSGLPPTGLTEIRSTADESANLAIFDGVAYVSTKTGIYPVASSGRGDLITPTNSGFGSLTLQSTTRIIKSLDGQLYYAANFRSAVGGGPALYNLSNPNLPMISWVSRTSLPLIIGLFVDLEGVGIFGDGAARLLPSGDIEPFILSPNANTFTPIDVASEGLVAGAAGIPNTVGAAAAALFQDGTVEFFSTAGAATSIRQRPDGLFNIGYFADHDTVIYGSDAPIQIDESVGIPTGSESVLVAKSEFVVVSRPVFIGDQQEFVYFPGVNPAGVDRSAPLVEFYPQLQALDFNRVVDIASSEGQIHLLLSGDDGLWLFAAPDPTVIPEPAALSVALLLHIALFSARRDRTAGPSCTGTLPSNSQVAKNCC